MLDHGRWLLRALTLGMVLLLAAAAFAQDIGLRLEQEKGLDPDFAANMRVEIIGQRLALACGLPYARFAIFNDRELNAFALPDGRVYITSLMAHSVSDDELAFVLGHELTHVKKKHAKHQQERATGGAILAAILVGVLGGSGGDIRVGADIAGGLALGHYSRGDENDADRGGLDLMARLGYDPTQAAIAMQRLIDKYGHGDAGVPILGWFATHPDSRTRRARLRDGAAALVQNSPPRMPPPLGVDLALDPSAVHAAAWARNYVSIALAAESQGRALVIPPMFQWAAPIITETPPLADPAKDADHTDRDKKKAQEEPLPPVTVTSPKIPTEIHIELALRQAPAGRAADGGPAVQATLRWTDTRSGLSGALAAYAQRRKPGPWAAQDELKDPAALTRLSDGKQDNIEGTLEAAAVRRIVRAYAEIVKAGGPVDHSVPVTLKLSEGDARVGEYVAVVRDGRLVAEVEVAQVKGKNVTGTVLWGTHVWKRGDRFLTMKS